MWHTGGKRFKNQVLNKAVSLPVNLYLGLRQLDGASGHPADAAQADTLALNLQEVSTTSTGYARIAIILNATNFPEAASGADSLITALAQVFTFTGVGLPVNGITHAFLATTSDNTGVLLCSFALSVTRNMGTNGDTITVTAKLLEEAGL
jgi:hypothetical protein